MLTISTKLYFKVWTAWQQIYKKNPSLFNKWLFEMFIYNLCQLCTLLLLNIIYYLTAFVNVNFYEILYSTTRYSDLFLFLLS